MMLAETITSEKILVYIHKVGLELEAFTSRSSCKNLAGVTGGVWHDDAGLNLCEMVTDPCEGTEEACEILRSMFQQSNMSEIYFTPYRPPELMHNSGRWQNYKPRYTALVEGLQRESSEHWHGVNQMTDWAALQVNVSGTFNPFGNDGAFLINIFNNLAPFLANRIHQEQGCGKGHLAIWSKFALSQRFPQYDRWLGTGDALKQYIEAVPRLFVERKNDIFSQPQEGEMQSFTCPLDLGVMWWLMRPKLNEQGVAYLECRHMPSMPLVAAEQHVANTLQIIEWFLTWFHDHNKGRPVMRIEDAVPAFTFVSGQVSEIVPTEPLTRREWHKAILS